MKGKPPIRDLPDRGSVTRRHTPGPRSTNRPASHSIDTFQRLTARIPFSKIGSSSLVLLWNLGFEPWVFASQVRFAKRTQFQSINTGLSQNNEPILMRLTHVQTASRPAITSSIAAQLYRIKRLRYFSKRSEYLRPRPPQSRFLVGNPYRCIVSVTLCSRTHRPNSTRPFASTGA